MSDLAVTNDDDAVVGLEDIEATDLVMPRLGIDHKTAEFVDNTSGARYTEIECILLGLVKQRILWHPEVDEGDQPLCKSYDFHHGHPNDDFPWSASGFDAGATDSDGRLPCSGCALKEWDSHPKNKTPWCSEQHTFPLVHLVDGGEQPSLLTVQRSAIRASKAYLTGFSRQKQPLFVARTKISLQAMSRGSVTYAVPSFARVGDVDAQHYDRLADAFRSIRSFLHTPPQRDDDDGDGGTTTVTPKAATAAPAAPAKPTAATPQSASAPTTGAVPVSDDDDDDLPF